MTTHSRGVPDGYHSVNTYIVVEGVEGVIDFLRDVFGGIERREREISADGTIGHTEVQIGDSVVMLSEATPEYPPRPSVHFAYVPDVDSVFRNAVAAGAIPILEPVVQPWGDRVGGFHDPFDNRWWVATRITNVTQAPTLTREFGCVRQRAGMSLDGFPGVRYGEQARLNDSERGCALAETYTNGIWLVKEGKEDEFVAAWREFASWGHTWPGCGTLRLVRDHYEPNRFMSFGPWESFEAQQAWKDSPEFKERIMRVRQHVEDFTPSVFEHVTAVE